jgi:hypothetical protein
VIDDRVCWIAVLVLGRPDIICGRIYLECVEMARDTQVLKDCTGTDVVLDEIARPTLAFRIYPVAVPDPEVRTAAETAKSSGCVAPAGGTNWVRVVSV